MARTEWGLKRTCQSCGAKFYDMNRAPIVCPKCSATFDPEALLKARRSKAPAVVAKPAPADEVDTADPEVAAETEEKEDEEEAVMEDTSELGQDSDDVEEVVDKDDAGEER